MVKLLLSIELLIKYLSDSKREDSSLLESKTWSNLKDFFYF